MGLSLTSAHLIILFALLVCQGLSQQQQGQANPASQPGAAQQQVPPPLPPCYCDQLDKCYNEHRASLVDLENRCRQDCGVAFLTNETAENVTKCYEEYAQGKREKKNSKTRCMENLIGRRTYVYCASNEQQQPPTQLTLSVDQSKMAQHRVKRQYKTHYPAPLNLYNACVKTCLKNRGKVEFNPDGTPIRPKGKTVNTGGTQNTGRGQKVPKGYASCAAQLNCQLVTHDRKLEKQAKDICKYEAAQKEDLGLKLCKCLESALNQTFPCMSSYTVPTCSSESGENGKSGCGGGNGDN